jgi:hypothetical protein
VELAAKRVLVATVITGGEETRRILFRKEQAPDLLSSC